MNNKKKIIQEWDSKDKRSKPRFLRKTYPTLTQDIINQTSFLDTKATLTQRFWHWRHDTYHKPKCKYCKTKEVNWDIVNQDYRIYCSKKCANLDLAIQKDENRYFHVCKNENCGNKVYRPDRITCSVDCWNEYKTQVKLSDKEFYEQLNSITDFSTSAMVSLSKDYPFHNTLLDKMPQNWPSHYQIKKKVLYLQGKFDPFKNQRWKDKIKEKYPNVPDYVESESQLSKWLKMMESPTCFNFGCTNGRVRFKNLKTNRLNSRYSKFCSKKCKKEYHETIRIRNEQIELERQNKEPLEPWNKNNDWRLNSKEWLETQHIKNKLPKVAIASMLEVDKETISNRFKQFDIKSLTFDKHYQQDVLTNFIKECVPNLKVIKDTRSVIQPKELDIYIPELKIAFEYCGLYWHCDKHDRITPNYHYDKWKKCQEQGIQLITIYEDEWLLKNGIVKSKIRSILNVTNQDKIGARKTEAKIIDKSDSNGFFDEYHIQGSGPGSINIGLFYENCLVACGTFINRNDEYVLNRYASVCNVQGGCGKIISHLLQNYKNKPIVSFSDNRWGSGRLYETLGFKYESDVKYDYYYFTPGTLKRHHKFAFRRQYLKTKLSNYNPSLSEVKNCANNGYHRIWNCGLKKWIYRPNY